MTRAWVVIDADGDSEISFRYDPSAVAALKSAVPSYGRKWIPADKVWLVWATYTATALHALRSYFGNDGVEVIDQRAKPKPVALPVVERHWSVALFDRLPERLAEPVYRALSKVLHPDIGGDGRMMQELNDTYQDRRRDGAA